MGRLMFAHGDGSSDFVHSDRLLVPHHLLFLVERSTSDHHLHVVAHLQLFWLIKLVALRENTTEMVERAGHMHDQIISHMIQFTFNS